MSEVPPKLFVSYSWSSPEHVQWVLKLATELRSAGVDVVLDKWDLKEGHDAISFMEQMVTDAAVTKVVLVCDHKYAEKADGRSGGVGTEAQIISPKIYGQVSQDKFVAVVAETDADGRPYLPTYYGSRIYIDLSDETLYGSNFEQLLRWAHNKPLYVKPKIGKAPAFLTTDHPIVIGTTPLFRRALDAVRAARSYAIGAIDEYLERLSIDIEAFRIKRDKTKQFDDQVVENIESFLPYRNEFIELTGAVAKFADHEDTRATIHRFFERLIPYLDRPETVNSWYEDDFDNFRFLVHELFLYAVAALLKDERFAFVTHLLQPFYAVSRGRARMEQFGVFREHVQSLERRNQRLNLRRLSVHADLLEQRARTAIIRFEHLMQADFFLFMRASIHALRTGEHEGWWPHTLVYCERLRGPFEIFARAESKAYFERLKPLLGIASKQEIDDLMTAFQNRRLFIPQWQHTSPAIWALANYERLAAAP